MMNKEQRNQLLFVLIIIAVPFAIYYMLAQSNFGTRLKVFGPDTVNEKGETVAHTVAPFSFVNQLGDTITQEDVKDKIYIANFFFASCPTICPKMLTQVMRVQEEFKDNDHFLILSHTVDPRHDSVAALRRYSHIYNADSSKWYFLTGERKKLYLAARNSYLTDNLEGDGGPTDFIHSQYILLVDPDRHIRGFYEGTDPDDIDRLIEETHELMKEFGYEE